MWAKTAYLANKLLDHSLRNTAYTAPVTVYLGLTTTLPTEAAAGTEVAGGSYARVAVTFNVAAGSLADNTGAITFPAATADWGEVVGLEIWDASSAGNRLYYGNPSTLQWPFTAAASTEILTVPGSTIATNNRFIVKPLADGVLPTGLTVDTMYYAVTVSGATFQASLTSGGAAINLTADGSGLVCFLNFIRTVLNGDTYSIAAGNLDVIEL